MSERFSDNLFLFQKWLFYSHKQKDTSNAELLVFWQASVSYYSFFSPGYT